MLGNQINSLVCQKKELEPRALPIKVRNFVVQLGIHIFVA